MSIRVAGRKLSRPTVVPMVRGESALQHVDGVTGSVVAYLRVGDNKVMRDFRFITNKAGLTYSAISREKCDELGSYTTGEWIDGASIAAPRSKGDDWRYKAHGETAPFIVTGLLRDILSVCGDTDAYTPRHPAVERVELIESHSMPGMACGSGAEKRVPKTRDGITQANYAEWRRLNRGAAKLHEWRQHFETIANSHGMECGSEPHYKLMEKLASVGIIPRHNIDGKFFDYSKRTEALKALSKAWSAVYGG